MYKQVKVRITGVSPLILHNSQTADPSNKFAKALKEVSSKRKKVDSDYEEMSRIEYLAGLYMSDGKVIIPSHVFEACLISGAKKSKSGVQAKSGLLVENDAELIYNGPKTAQELFESEEFKLIVPVKVGTARVMRTRPRFKKWSAEFEISYMEGVLNEREVVEFATAGGMLCGIGDWRPKHGRFTVEVI